MGLPCEKILCVDDDPGVLKAIKRTLRNRLSVVTACGGEEGLAVLREQGPFAVVVADYWMPGMNGVEFLRQAHILAPDTVKIMLTVSREFEVAVNALHEGHICRFLVKTSPCEVIEQTLRECVGYYRENAAQKGWRQLHDSPDEMVRAAWIDPVMGICNRAAFENYHAQLHGKAMESGQRYALFMADVDHFKNYNDYYGHAAGDDALCSVATAMKKSLRAGEMIARYGGEEIVVLSEDASSDHAILIAERMRNAVWNLGIEQKCNENYGRVTISVGLAVFDPDSTAQPKDLIIQADRALYKAKRAGRNRVVLAPALDVTHCR